MMPKPTLTLSDILALVEAGRWDDARAAYDAALARDRDDLDLLADASWFFVEDLGVSGGDRDALGRGLELARRARRLASRQDEEELAADLGVVEAVALNELGDCTAALAAAESVLEHDPESPDALLEKGSALYELCRFEDAREALTHALRVTPDAAWGHHLLGLVLERLGAAREAEKHFATARRLAPKDFREPLRLSQEEFDGVVEAALADELPESVRRWLANVAITVEDFPELDDLTASNPPLSPSSLGMFRGSPLGDKASMDPWSHFPSSIVLYQRNLERMARDRDELVHEIGVTLLHEVGHFLGLDEEDLAERGLD